MKSTIFPCLVFGLLIFTTSYAQTACPPGMEEYGAGVCGYSQSEQPSPQTPEPQLPPSPSPSPQWSSRWGAIATDMTHGHGSGGAAVNQPSQTQAEQAALAECKSNGGLTCKIDLAYHDQCAALVVSAKGYNAGSAATIDEAIRLGIKVCTESGATGCHAYYSACSLPARVK